MNFVTKEDIENNKSKIKKIPISKTIDMHGITILKSLLVFVSLLALASPVSAYSDDFQHYATTNPLVNYYEIQETSGNAGFASWSGSSIIYQYPSSYSQSQSLKIVSSVSRSGTGGYRQGLELLKSKSITNPNYLSFNVRSWVPASSGGNYGKIRIRYYNNTDVVLGTFDIPYSTTGLYELINSNSNIQLYVNGGYISSIGTVSQNELATFGIGVFTYNTDYGTLDSILILDDISTSGIVGINNQYTDLDTEIQASYTIYGGFNRDYGRQMILQNPQGTVDYFQYIGTGTAMDDPVNNSGFIRIPQTELGSNYGTYVLYISVGGVVDSTHQFDYVSVLNISPPPTSISFDADSYVVEDYPVISWSISYSDWNTWNCGLGAIFPCSWATTLLNNGVQATLSTGEPIGTFDIPTQTGSYQFRADISGGYEIKLSKGFFSFDVQDTDTALITPATQSVLLINATVPYRSQVPVIYSWGVGGDSLNRAIRTFYYDPITNEYQFEHSFFGLTVSGTRNVYFETIGKYKIDLYDFKLAKSYKSAITQTQMGTPITNRSITSSSLFISKNTYNYGDAILGNFTIDSMNWSTYPTMLDVYNYDLGTQSAEFPEAVYNQVQELFLIILNTPASQSYPERYWFTGNNTLRLIYKNSSGAITVLKTANFTLLDMTSTGYGLKLSKYKVQQGEVFYAYVTTPESAILSFINVDTNKTLLNYNINGSSKSKTISLSSKTLGNHAVILFNPSGEEEIMLNVEVIEKVITVTPLPTPIIDPGIEDGTESFFSFIDSWVEMVFGSTNNTTRFGFALLIVAAILIMVTIATKNLGIGVVCAFFPYAFFLFLSLTHPSTEYMPVWTGVFIALIIGIKLKWFS